LPFGIFKILKSAKKTKQLDLLLGGIKKDCQGLGLDALLALKMMESANISGYRFLDSHLELETNYKIKAEMEKWGGKIYKKYRVFQKDLII
jgi:hypothetical protein